MAKNLYSMQPKQTAFSMSPSYSHTVSAVLDEDDDNDICPVCDGECTCSNNVSRSLPPPPPPPPHTQSTGPLSMEELSRQYKVVTSSSTPLSQPRPQLHHHQVPKPSLKIKFTVPHNLLAKKRVPLNDEDTPSFNQYPTGDQAPYAEESNDDQPVAGPSTIIRSPPLYQYPVKPVVKKRGRPRKAINLAIRDLSADAVPRRRVSTSPVLKRSNPKASIVGRQKLPSYATKVVKTTKAHPYVPPPIKKRTKKMPAPKRRRPAFMDSDASESSPSDDDMFGPSGSFAVGDDMASVQFPTFVSASALSSMNSDGNSSDSSSLSGFSDSSIEKEEEGFILSEMQQRTRVNRELLGDNARKGGQSSQNNEWIIRPRKRSEGPSDVELDSDATEDDDDEDVRRPEEADGEDEGDETDGHSAGGRGLVTGWSDDEESSFDADLFFANLSSTEDSDSSSDESMRERGLNDSDDDTVSDASTEAGLLNMREELENLPLELTESWDGHLVFTNGSHSGGGGGLIDIDFERDASQFIPAPPCCPDGSSPSHDYTMVQDGSDIEMSSFDSDGDDGYEEDGGEAEGDTTDEELVGEDDLPNERAMILFNFPSSVNSINPLSTVSPMVTPAKYGRFGFGSNPSSPTPHSHSGKMFWDSDEMDEMFDRQGHHRSQSLSSKASGGGPRKGMFCVAKETRQAVIDDSHSDIPSPHPKFNRGRRGRHLSVIEALLRKHFSTPSRREPSFATTVTVAADHSPLRLLPSLDIAAPPGPSSLTDDRDNGGLTTPIELDEVLDEAFLRPDPTESGHTPDGSHGYGPPESATTGDESDSNNQELRRLHRWDVISVGAFRQTRENARIMDSPGAPSWTPDSRRTPGSSADYGNIMKASPFSTMLWPTQDKFKRAAAKRDREAVVRTLSTSPVMGSGDRTPTKNLNRGGGSQHQEHEQKYKGKRESKKQKRIKKKGFMPNGSAHPGSHHFHSHNHHPNSKSRSGVQRNNFLSSVSPLNV